MEKEAEPRQSQESSVSTPPPVPAKDSLSLLPADLLLVVFIHGFKGTDETFGAFPQRLQHVLSETIENVKVECIVFPSYETKGELSAAVEQFADWLTSLTVEREVASGTGGGAGKAKIVLCGHSMGGLLAADTLLAMVHSRPDQNAPLWPKIIALIAYDTPYYGLHPHVFKNHASKAFEFAGAARDIGSAIFGAFGGKKGPGTATSSKPLPALPAPEIPSGANWTRWATAAGGAAIASAAAGAAYWKRNEIGTGYLSMSGWMQDHMKYVGNLWDEDAMKRRVDQVIEVNKRLGVAFHDFYTFLPPSPPHFPDDRTFCILPKKNTVAAEYFSPAVNALAPDETQAHMNMFGPRTNDGYYALGLATARIVRMAVLDARGVAVAGGNEQQNAEQKAGNAMSDDVSTVDKAQEERGPLLDLPNVEEGEGEEGAEPSKDTA